MPVPTISAPAPSSHRRSTNGRYTYRANASQSQASARTEHGTLTHALGLHRQLLSHAASAIRALSAARNELIAQSIEDGLPIGTVAAVTGENMKAVRTIGLAYDDLHPSGLHPQAHLSALQAKSNELRAAESHRDKILERREALIRTAIRNKVCDDLELASLTGLTPGHIRQTARGITRTS